MAEGSAGGALSELFDRCVVELAECPGSASRHAGAALADQLAQVRGGVALTELTVRWSRTLSEADPDQEWAETSAHAELWLSPGRSEVRAYRNLATMVGASQSDEVVAGGPAGAPAGQGDIEAWLSAARALWNHPDHQVVVGHRPVAGR